MSACRHLNYTVHSVAGMSVFACFSARDLLRIYAECGNNIHALLFISLAAAAAAVATDCERPPHVDNASVNVVDDETGDLVSATYACAAGYRLLGEAELFCDLDTDEWQGDPPACRAGKCDVRRDCSFRLLESPAPACGIP